MIGEGADNMAARDTVSRSLLSITVLSTCCMLAMEYLNFYKYGGGAWGLAWGSVGEALIGSILIHRLSACELKFGSNHYAVFLLISYILNALLGFLISHLLPKIGIEPPKGPNAILIALSIRYWLEIPENLRFSVLGFRLSNKVCEYLLAVQLSFSSLSAAVGAIEGILIGFLFTFNIMYLRKVYLPSFLVPLVRTFCTLLSALQSPTSFRHLHESWGNLDLRNIGSSTHAPSVYNGPVQAAPYVVPNAGRPIPADQLGAAHDEEAELQRAIQLSLESNRSNNAPRH